MQRGAIFRLSGDLLEDIFMLYVNEQDASPVTLSQVCRQWRAIARESARLWTRIDLGHGSRAKHYVELSKEAGLAVTWANWSPRSHATLTMSSRDWVWAHAGRFVRLVLMGSSELVQHVMCRVGEELPMLYAVEIVVGDASPALRSHIPLALKLPKLVSLCLR